MTMIKGRRRKHDPDYSPAMQDEYQRLWHRDASALRFERERNAMFKQALEDVLHLKYTATTQDAQTMAARVLSLDEK